MPFTFPKYTLSCFLNSFELQLLRLIAIRLRGSQFSQNISQHFTAPCHRRFSVVIHLSLVLEDSENTEPCRLHGVKNCYKIFWGRFVDTRPIVRPRLPMHFADILNGQLRSTNVYSTTTNNERRSYLDTLISESMISFADSPFKFPLLPPSRLLGPVHMEVGDHR